MQYCCDNNETVFVFCFFISVARFGDHVPWVGALACVLVATRGRCFPRLSCLTHMRARTHTQTHMRARTHTHTHTQYQQLVKGIAGCAWIWIYNPCCKSIIFPCFRILYLMQTHTHTHTHTHIVSAHYSLHCSGILYFHYSVWSLIREQEQINE